LSAGEACYQVAIAKKIPQIVSVGTYDMVNFDFINTVPKKFSTRNLYKHNPTVNTYAHHRRENKQLAKNASTS